MDRTDIDQQLARISALGEPVRRALYNYVAARGAPVGRDEAAAAVGIGRPLAAYHLDRLVAEGLLAARYERRGARRGPGAGRPSKLYIRSAGQVEVSVPPRDYELAARILARAVESDPSGAARRRVEEVARATGAELAAEAAGAARDGRRAGEGPAALLETLNRHGYEPYEPCPDDLDEGAEGGEGGAIRLRNCPFDKLTGEHRELVCGVNLALLEGAVERLGVTALQPVLEPRAGECCVAFRRVPL
jgi:predicted ArsR family transcriptional regulator